MIYDFFQSAAAADRACWARFGVHSLLTSSAKTKKGEEKDNALTGIMYVTPGPKCPWSTRGCREDCLGKSSGHMPRGSVQKALACRMVALEEMLKSANSIGWDILAAEIRHLAKKAERLGMTPAVRLNGTSDVMWWTHPGFKLLKASIPSEVVFYEYTKNRDLVMAQKASYAGVHLTMSWREDWDYSTLARMINAGYNVAVVFRTKKGEDLPDFFHGVPVLDGDLSDARFRDPDGVVVGLRAKGTARQNMTGFVVDP